jgi:hypothetical protein
MCLFCGLQIAIDCLLRLMQVSVGHPNFLFGGGGGGESDTEVVYNLC